MGQRHKPGGARQSPADQAMRDQEVLRANRELAAYFKGRRTEREARAAVKIIKAFIRDRERRDAASRPPLPGAHASKADEPKNRSARPGAEPHRRKPRRKSRKTSKGETASIEPQQNPESPQPSQADERVLDQK
jgi:hypothetical protein